MPIADDLRYDIRVRPIWGTQPGQPPAVLTVAEARARYPEYRPAAAAGRPQLQ